MMNCGKDLEGSSHWHNLRYYPSIHLEGTDKNHKKPVKIAGFQALDPGYVGQNPAKVIFKGDKNPRHAFLGKGSKAVGCML
jgi:hypothetical protein